MAQAPVELLGRVPLFSGLGRRELERVASSMKERRFQKGDTLTTEGRGGVGFFVIEQGEADVTVHGDERAKLGPGDYFGEIALITESDRTATITAETDMLCYGMTMWDFRPLVESNASIAWNMLQSLAQKLRDTERSQSA
jgi:CRP/FNR family cyclic AMP-dependent transcriptional regulator